MKVGCRIYWPLSSLFAVSIVYTLTMEHPMEIASETSTRTLWKQSGAVGVLEFSCSSQAYIYRAYGPMKCQTG